MGCRSDYMEPNQAEIENSKVLALLEEIKTGKLGKLFGTGYAGKSGNYAPSDQKSLDKNTAELCGSLKKATEAKLKKMSLELQIWWRDHQKADKRHKAEDAKERKEAKIAETAKAKLTPKERKALGI